MFTIIMDTSTTAAAGPLECASGAGCASAWKKAPDASHRVVLDEVHNFQPRRILDLSGGGILAAELRKEGHFVVGVDTARPLQAEVDADRTGVADLDAGLPPEIVTEAPFDLVITADVLEHLRAPELLLRELHEVCTADTVLVATIPNISHWYPRLRIGFGRFDYDHRGILDTTHLRFFTWRSFRGMAHRAGWRVKRRRLSGLPFEILDRGEGVPRTRPIRKLLGLLDRIGRAVWPSLFAYQYVATLERDPARVLREESEPRASRGLVGVSN